MKKQARFIFTTFSLVAFGALFINSDNGRTGNYVGLSTDSGTCGAVGCHAGKTANGLGVTVSGAPASYVAGQVYPLTLTLKDPTAISGGFQIEATNGVTTAHLGAFTPGVGNKLNNTLRPVQSSPKLFASGAVSWSFSWTAPATGTAVKFFYSAVASNNDGLENVGDAVYTGSQAGPLSAVADIGTVNRLSVSPTLVSKGGDIRVETGLNSAETRLQIVDLSGRVLKTVQKAANTEGVNISTACLPTGSFLIQSVGNFIPQTQRFIVF